MGLFLCFFNLPMESPKCPKGKLIDLEMCPCLNLSVSLTSTMTTFSRDCSSGRSVGAISLEPLTLRAPGSKPSNIIMTKSVANKYQYWVINSIYIFDIGYRQMEKSESLVRSNGGMAWAVGMSSR